MKRWNLKSTLLFALLPMVMLLAVNGEAQARMMDFTYSGSIVTYDVPTTGTSDITAYGAEGGRQNCSVPGLGAEIGGDFFSGQWRRSPDFDWRGRQLRGSGDLL